MYFRTPFPLSSARPTLSFVRFYLASGYSASCSSFQLSSRFSSQRLPGAPSVLSFLRFFPFRPGLVSHPFLPVLLTQLSCIVSFRPSQFRSRSRSTGAHLTFCFWASSQMFAHAFRPLSFSSGLELNYSASVSSFPFFHRFCLTVGFSVSQVCFRFLVFPLISSLVSRAFFPVLSTQLSVCFLSSFPASLPQLFHRCFPFGFLLWDQRLASVLFRSLPL